MRTRASLLGSLVEEARRKSQDFLGPVILPEISNGTGGSSYGSGSAGSRFMETVRKALSSAKNSTLSKGGTNESSTNGNANSSLPGSNNNSFKLRHHNSVTTSPIIDNSSSSTLQVARYGFHLPAFTARNILVRKVNSCLQIPELPKRRWRRKRVFAQKWPHTNGEWPT